MANPALNRLANDYDRGGWGTAHAQGGVVTLDSVVQKTAMTLGLLILTAIATWVYVQNLVEAGNVEAFGAVATGAFIASMVAFGLSLFISFKRVTSPALILIFAAVEGVVIGFLSKAVALQVGSNEPVVGAVIGTFVTTAATLAAYKFFNIQVTNRMRKIVTIAMFAFIGVALADAVLYMFGAGIGVNGFGTVGVLFSFVGIGIALFMLLIDFDAVERAIEYRLPEVESWRLAFGLTVTLVWIYVNLLKILSYFQRD